MSDIDSLLIRPETAKEVFDDKNLEILELLSNKSSLSVQSIADRTEIEEEAVNERVKKLFESGFLETVNQDDYKGFRFDFDEVAIVYGDMKKIAKSRVMEVKIDEK